jgi:hypothetical protein
VVLITEMLEICIQTSYDQNVQLILKSYLPVVYGTPLRENTLCGFDHRDVWNLHTNIIWSKRSTDFKSYLPVVYGTPLRENTLCGFDHRDAWNPHTNIIWSKRSTDFKELSPCSVWYPLRETTLCGFDHRDAWNLHANIIWSKRSTDFKELSPCSVWYPLKGDYSLWFWSPRCLKYACKRHMIKTSMGFFFVEILSVTKFYRQEITKKMQIINKLNLQILQRNFVV